MFDSTLTNCPYRETFFKPCSEKKTRRRLFETLHFPDKSLSPRALLNKNPPSFLKHSYPEKYCKKHKQKAPKKEEKNVFSLVTN